MLSLIPNKLKKGDHIRVIAPSRSLSMISKESRASANARFAAIGLKLSFGRHVDESNMFTSTSIESRVSDLHDAFQDEKIAGIITVIGGYNANQLLRYIDWKIIRHNPKVFLGYSDITALQNAILTKANLVTYSGPHYADFAEKKYFDYTLSYFQKCLMENRSYAIEESPFWTDDPWYIDQNKRHKIQNAGIRVLTQGSADGTIVGGNLCTFNLLQGTPYCPSLTGSILFLEDDEASTAELFDRDLQSVIHQPQFSGVRGLLVGRFQKKSNISDGAVRRILTSKEELAHIPVAYNVDFGHTNPKFTFPIGGNVNVKLSKDSATIIISRH